MTASRPHWWERCWAKPLSFCRWEGWVCAVHAVCTSAAVFLGELGWLLQRTLWSSPQDRVCGESLSIAKCWGSRAEAQWQVCTDLIHRIGEYSLADCDPHQRIWGVSFVERRATWGYRTNVRMRVITTKIISGRTFFCSQSSLSVAFWSDWESLLLSTCCCRCGRFFDAFGRHREACLRIGELERRGGGRGGRGWILESAGVCMCLHVPRSMWEGRDQRHALFGHYSTIWSSA